ncbi:MAG: protein kinase [Candidatus Schekmanbacteria bacterium]|nr:protein kinase [Candidatus Schekmanbacteria bacterium]
MSQALCKSCGHQNSARNTYCTNCGSTLREGGTDEGLGASPIGSRVFSPDGFVGSKYELVERVGSGSMGIVFRARDRFIGREVAVKAINLDVGGDLELLEQLRRRFEREVKAAGSLNHPNIVTVYEAGEAEKFYYIVMEFLDGTTLKQLNRHQDVIPISNVVSYMRQIASALDYSFRQHIVHRDIKPENIIVLRDDRIKITDFGIAKVLSSAVIDITRGDRILGTPNYMAPEQVKGERVDGRTDLFSLGCVFYELLAKRKPFHQGSVGAILFNIISRDPEWLSELDPRMPAVYDDILKKLLAKDPAARYRDAGELLAALDAIAPDDITGQVDAVREAIYNRQSAASAQSDSAPGGAAAGSPGEDRDPWAPESDDETRAPQRAGASREDSSPKPIASAAGRRDFSRQESEEIRTTFQNGVKLYRDQRFTEAVREMRRVLELNPEHEVAAQFLAMAERKLRKPGSKVTGDGSSSTGDGTGEMDRVTGAGAPRGPGKAPRPVSRLRGVLATVLTVALVALVGGGILFADEIIAYVKEIVNGSGPNDAPGGATPPATGNTPTAGPRPSPEQIEEHYQKARECRKKDDEKCLVDELDFILRWDPQHAGANRLLNEYVNDLGH